MNAEAYRPSRIKYCCPITGGGGAVPISGSGYPFPGQGLPQSQVEGAPSLARDGVSCYEAPLVRTEVPLERTWKQWMDFGMEMRYPLDGGQTENITTRRTSWAGGNKLLEAIKVV